MSDKSPLEEIFLAAPNTVTTIPFTYGRIRYKLCKCKKVDT